MGNGAAEGPRRLSINPTLVLGLGGTGREVVSKLKSIVRSRLPGPAAENPVVRFLALDTDAGEAARAALGETGPGGLDASEFLALPVEDVEGLLANREKHPHVFSWFPDGVTARDLKYGANQCRPLGRLAFFWNAATVRRTVETALKHVTNLRHRTVAQGLGYGVPEGVHVFIVSSICGGTGSGMLLDASCLCRSLADRAELIGLLILPSAFGIEQQAAIEANGYATLRELEAVSARREFVARYGDSLEIRMNGTRPFDRAYLVDAWNERARHLDTSDNVFRMVAETLFAKIYLGMYERHRSIVDNVQPRFSRTLDGRLTAWSSLGHASLRLPGARVRAGVARRKAAALLAAWAGEGEGTGDDAAGEAGRFLADRGLEEGAFDTLLTGLREVEGRPWRPAVDHAGVEDLPVEEIPVHAGRVELGLRQGLKACLEAMEGNRERRFAALLDAFRERVDAIVLSGGGARAAGRFALALAGRARTLGGLLDEECEAKFRPWKRNLFVAQKKERLTGLLGGFLAALFRRGAILAALEEFTTELSRDVAYDVEIASRRQAAELYRSLAGRTDAAAGRLLALADRFDRARADADAEAARLAAPTSAEGFITDLEIMADAAAAGRFLDATRFDDAALAATAREAAGGPFAEAEPPEGELEAALFAAVARQVVAGLDLSLPAVLGAPNALAPLVPALVDSAAPFWEFSKVHLPSGHAPDEILVVSLDESLRDAFRRACPDAARLVYSEPADAERVPAFRFKHGLPLFALKRVRGEFRVAYESAVAAGRALHVLPLDGAPDLVP